MAWTTPATFVVGAILTAAQLNTHLRDNTRYLKGLDGEIVLSDYIDFPSTAQGDVFYHDGTKLARLAAGTSGYFLKAQGAAANPTWAVGTSSLTMVTTTDKSPTKDNNWYDVDLSTGSFVPSGTRAVQVLFTVPDADNNACIVGARKNGSADTATWNMGDSAVGNRAVFSMWCEIDTNRIIEILIQNSNGTAYINAYCQ